ncbi:MAG TPA: molybdate ABC transporter substrate-binding protein [Longilinea sp.]|nr:molybdate ABC transporter substrate-binding protein [Longilinea sp.]
MRRILLFFLMSTMLLSGCQLTSTQVSPPKKLTVYAAASLTNAFDEIGKIFMAANPGVTVAFNFAGSQALRTQIEEGAKADVFASANMKEMDTLVSGNYVAVDDVSPFMTNQLIVIMPANNPAELTSLVDLSKPGVKIVLAAKEVPIGNYAQQVLDNLDSFLGAGYKEKVLANVVSYENDVKQVVAKVQLGEADAGIVYSSDAIAAPELKKIDIPVEHNVVAKYPLAPLLNSENPELAQAFIDFILSSQGQAILQNWGFLPLK